MLDPILDGRLADDAWRAIRDIARAIADGAGVLRDPGDLLLFWSYLAGAIDEAWVIAEHERAQIDMLAALDHEGSLALFSGLAGTGWVIAHTSGDGANDDVLDAIDTRLVGEVEGWSGSFDLVGGLVGVGVYLLERGPVGTRGLEVVISRLGELAERRSDGTAWFTPPAFVAPGHATSWPDGYFNCGVAHGNPGVVALLARAGAAQLCTDGSRWLLAQRLERHPRGRFPEVVGRDARPVERARAAWCYGDPGVAIALWSAAARGYAPRDEVLELARDAAVRLPDDSDVVDAGLCHGAAGLAHMFSRFHQATGHDVFRTAARSWFERTLAMRRDGGIAGFAAWVTEWVPSASFLNGATGVALALLAGVHASEPVWDRRLLCDL